MNNSLLRSIHQSGTSSTYKRVLLTSCAAAALAATLTFVTPAPAATPVQTSVKQDYARILFSWPEKTTLTTKRNGRTLQVRFSNADDIATSAITNSLSRYISSASQSSDKRTLTLTLKEPYETRHFISGTKNGIDILFDKQDASQATIVSDSRPITTKDDGDASILSTKRSAKKAPAPSATPKTKTQTASVERFKPVPVSKPSFAPSSEEPATPVDVADTKAANAQPASDSAANPKAAADTDTTEKTVADATAATTNEQSNSPSKTPEDLTVFKDAPTLLVGVKKDRHNDTFFFDVKERTGVSSFQHGANMYVVLSNPYNVDIGKLRSVLPDSIQSVRQIPHEDATILQFGANNNLSAIARKAPEGYSWQVEISRKMRTPRELTMPKLVSQNVRTPYVMLEALQTADPVAFTDSASGEEIVAIPSYAHERGVYPARSVPDVTVLETGQGIAYMPHHRNIVAKKLRNGIRITARDNGLIASQDLAALPQDIMDNARQYNHTFFPYNQWKTADNAEFFSKENRLLSDITLADARQKPHALRALTQHYMAEGMYMEALGLLGIIQEDHPAFYDEYQLAALQGASNFMLDRIDAAAGHLYAPEIADEDEMAHWHRMIEVIQGDTKYLDFSEFYQDYAQNYPPTLLRRIAMLAADNALAQKKYSAVLNIFDILEQSDQMEPVRDYANYMIGRIYAETDKMEQARATLEPLAENPDDRFLRARAAFTLATTDYKNGEIDRPELIARLEPLRHVWRGDSFELNLLHLLGELYVNNGQYAEGLRAWRDVVNEFPTTQIAQDAQSRMGDTFISLFNEGEANDLTPVSALALYYEFRDLTPFGREGDKMIQHLADRLANVDLLDRAASLLEHQVSYRLEKEERSKVGAQLALIHLLNREPEKTLDVLEVTGYGSSDESLIAKRNHLGALGHAKVGNWQRALHILRDDYSKESKMIRTDIYWDIKDWDNVVISAEDILNSRDDITAPLDESEAQALLKLAVAYTFKQDRDQLQYLRDYFMPLIADTQKKETFDFLTSGIDPVNRRNIARLSEEISKMKGFLDNYEVTIANDGLSATF